MEGTLEYRADGMLVLKTEQTLPDVLDLLIVGGGPAGTSAAFHARELGLTTLVVDYDDLMKRIRDYPKDKLILPDFGGGDQMKFPKGGPLVAALQFPPIDKDDICKAWKRLYYEQSIPAQVGIELLGLTRLSDGVLQAKTWNHNRKCEQTYSARHLAIAIGRGVPRRFDIPGNTDGIAYRLVDAATYVGQPALVIGGGTSGGEAVIAISHAKLKANDLSTVYWSYRGSKLPKVSKSLAETLFDAYLGNGNIRYLPDSEPFAITTLEDRKDYLSVRVDRKQMIGRPSETLHMEFPKTSCIACIGEDIPETFLNSIGIFMATGGPSKKKRMVVTPLLETQQPNVYLIGDILSQAYLETNDFQGDPASFLEIKHRGNIKASLRDGVLVAKVVSQKIAGKKEFFIDLDFEEGVPIKEIEKATEGLAIVVGATQVSPLPVPAPRVKTTTVAKERKAFVVRMLAGNVEETEYPLMLMGVTTFGRQGCDIVFPDDPLLSPHHASLVHSGDQFSLRDDGSVTGVFLKAAPGKPLEVTPGDIVQVGRQFLRFDSRYFVQYDSKGKEVGRYLIAEKTSILGRDAPDFTLDAGDKALSRRHVALSMKEGKIFIKDLQSINGTYLKVTNRKVESGDMFRVGQQLFKVSLQEEKGPSTHLSTQKTVFPTPILQTVAPLLARASMPPSLPVSGSKKTVTFKNSGKCIAFCAGQTVCELAEKNGLKITAECHAGICGSDPIRILSGRANLNPLGSTEKETLEDLCGLSAGEYRMACMATPTGPIEVEIVSIGRQ